MLQLVQVVREDVYELGRGSEILGWEDHREGPSLLPWSSVNVKVAVMLPTPQSKLKCGLTTTAGRGPIDKTKEETGVDCCCMNGMDPIRG